MKQFNFVYGIALSFLVAGCTTATVSVLPGENLNRVVARDIERDGAEKAAVDGANKYCLTYHQEAVFLSDKQEYKGEMSESTRDLIRKGSQAAILLGGVGLAPARTRQAGGLLGSAGTVGYVMTSGRDFEAVAEFRCRGAAGAAL